jgi:uncharacterized protein (TIGR04141 family)
MGNNEKLQHISVYLIKDEYIKEEEILIESSLLDQHNIEINDQDIGMLYVEKTKVKFPKWLSFFQDYLDVEKLGIKSATGKAVLLVKVQNRFFALSFGQGRYLIEPRAIIQNFGLKVTINSINPDHIRTIDKDNIDVVFRHAREQASRELSISEFGLDVDRDMLRAVTGKPIDSKLGNILAGRDVLSTNAKVGLKNLKKQLSKYLKKYHEKSYQTTFPWIDNIIEIRDKSLLEKLNGTLIDKISNNKLELVWLSIPEIIDWGDVLGFKFARTERASIYPDIELVNFLKQINPRAEITLDYLKRKKVFCWSASLGQPIKTWSLFHCLYAEIQEGSDTYILNNGLWYQLNNNFVDSINAFYKSVPVSDIDLPCHRNIREDQYNKEVSESNPKMFALMDKKNIMIGGGSSRVEFCDIYTSSKVMIHVKKYGGSAVLSHLFSQGVVSATSLLSEINFRKQVNGKLPKSHKFDDYKERPTPTDFEVCYAIASNAPGDLVLPFFSKVSLKNAIKQLQILGFKYSIKKIDLK